MLQFVNNYRGVAILLVILVHSFRGVKHDYIWTRVFYSALDNVTIFFVVVAGYLFTVTTKDFNYKNYLKGKFYSVFLPYVFLSFPAVLLYMLHLKPYHWWIDMDWYYSLNIVYQYLYIMFYGAALGPLWFVPMIFIFYSFSPLFKFLCKHENLLILVFLVSAGIGLYVGRPRFNDFPFQSFIYFLPAYLLGMVLNIHPQWYRSIASYSLILLVLAIGGVFFFYYHFDDLYTEDHFHYDGFFKLILSLIIFSCCYKYLNFKIKSLDLFARLSFYLFFVHGYFTGFISVITRVFDFKVSGPAGLIWIWVFLAFIIISCLIGFVLGKAIFGKRSKLVLGA